MADQSDALAIAGYAVALELLSKLEERGLLTREDGAAVIDAALSGLERTAAQHPNAPLRMARQVLDHQLLLWRQDRSAPPSASGGGV